MESASYFEDAMSMQDNMGEQMEGDAFRNECLIQLNGHGDDGKFQQDGDELGAYNIMGQPDPTANIFPAPGSSQDLEAEYHLPSDVDMEMNVDDSQSNMLSSSIIGMGAGLDEPSGPARSENERVPYAQGFGQIPAPDYSPYLDPSDAFAIGLLSNTGAIDTGDSTTDAPYYLTPQKVTIQPQVNSSWNSVEAAPRPPMLDVVASTDDGQGHDMYGGTNHVASSMSSYQAKQQFLDKMTASMAVPQPPVPSLAGYHYGEAVSWGLSDSPWTALNATRQQNYQEPPYPDSLEQPDISDDWTHLSGSDCNTHLTSNKLTAVTSPSSCERPLPRVHPNPFAQMKDTLRKHRRASAVSNKSARSHLRSGAAAPSGGNGRHAAFNESLSKSSSKRLSISDKMLMRPSPPSPSITSTTRSHVDDPLCCEQPECNTLFTGRYRKGNYKRHMNTTHATPKSNGEKAFRCEVRDCDKQFSRSDALALHRRKRHPGQGDVGTQPQ